MKVWYVSYSISAEIGLTHNQFFNIYLFFPVHNVMRFEVTKLNATKQLTINVFNQHAIT